jgi:predicted aspartyl protease
MNGNFLIVTFTLQDQENVIKSHSLIDCGATSYAFIDEDYTHHQHLPVYLLKSPRNPTVIDGRPVTSSAITYLTRTRLAIWNHQKDIHLFVTTLGNYPSVLGIPCLWWHDVCLCSTQNKVIFVPSYSLSHCLDEALYIQGQYKIHPHYTST